MKIKNLINVLPAAWALAGSPCAAPNPVSIDPM